MPLTLYTPPALSDPAQGGAMRLVDAVARVEPTWVEAVAIVQAICARLEPGHGVPALDQILLSKSGRVSFPPAGRAVPRRAVERAGQLLSAILGQGVCPMPLWDAIEMARRAPDTFGSTRAFGASLTCLPAHQGPRDLAAYFASSLNAGAHTIPMPAIGFALRGLTTRAVLVLAAVTLCGIGAGVSVGTLLAARAVARDAAVPSPLDATAMLGADVVPADLK